ncbi:PepSY domain-containing protein [Streptomyces sp. B6B3]|uniref:PepSY domain-containing protein n=1 Tax=Streptomyces sp. B6B3 TaxID=3153570 RepID=UPI00325E13D3
MKRNVIIAVAAAAAVIGGGSLAGAALGTDDGNTGQASQTLASGEVVEGGGADDIGTDDTDTHSDTSADTGTDDAAGDAQRAAESALAEAPGVVTSIERDSDDGQGNGWEVGVWGDDGQWHHLRVSEDGSEVLVSSSGGDDSDDDGDDDGSDDDGRGLDDATVNLLREDGTHVGAAIRIAEDETGAALREADLEGDHWHVELRGDDGTEYELNVDLATGEITGQEQENDGDDDGSDDGWDGDDDSGTGNDDADDQNDQDDNAGDTDRDDRDETDDQNDDTNDDTNDDSGSDDQNDDQDD